MKTIIGVMGPGQKQATPEDIRCAYEMGKIVAKTGSVLLCGGMTGVMEASAKGAQENSGTVLGIGPTMDKKEMNKYIDIPVVTGMNAGRNFMNILSSDALIFVSIGSPGTLSELAYAIQLGKPSIVIRGSDKLKSYIEEFHASSVQFVDTLAELEPALIALLPTKND